MELKYYRCGDYYFPDLGLSEEEQRPVGKYGQMRMEYLRKNRPGLFTRLLLSGKLMEHLHEIDDTCHERIPKSLHRQLALASKREGVSMNQYCVFLLSQENAIHKPIKL